MRRFLFTLPLALLLASLSGCGTKDIPIVAVNGAVTMDGKPLEGATVTFHPPKGRLSAGVTNAEGKYELTFVNDRKGALPGNHKVSITTRIEPDSDADDPLKKKGRPESVPKKYNQQTSLETEVNAARKDPYNFELTSK